MLVNQLQEWFSDCFWNKSRSSAAVSALESESKYVLFSAAVYVIKHWWKLVRVAPRSPDLDKALSCWLPSCSCSMGNLNRVLSDSATHQLSADIDRTYRGGENVSPSASTHKRLGATDILSSGGHISDLGSNLVSDVPRFHFPLSVSLKYFPGPLCSAQ